MELMKIGVWWKMMETFPIRFTERQLDSLGEMVRQKIYPSASEAVRAAVGLLEDKHGIHGKPAKLSERQEATAA
jgi:Arc/MetJ-type ribon-helix-helix transcriptional regulator